MQEQQSSDSVKLGCDSIVIIEFTLYWEHNIFLVVGNAVRIERQRCIGNFSLSKINSRFIKFFFLY